MAGASAPWIVTRPGATGQALAAALAARGADAWWLPAFVLGPAPDPQQAQAALAALADFDLALFVSPAAVAATAQLLAGRPWPATTAIGAVGGGTREALLALLRPPAEVPLIAPDDGDAAAETDAATGSEAFWQALERLRRAQPLPLRRVLLLRAAQGREWLRERFAAEGSAVTALAVYARHPYPWQAADRDWLAARARAGAAPRLVVTSSEAVPGLLAQAQAAAAADPAAAGVAAWLRRGRALAQHPRIVARLQAAGFADAHCVRCELEALLAAA